jgi:hypothetical protein
MFNNFFSDLFYVLSGKQITSALEPDLAVLAQTRDNFRPLEGPVLGVARPAVGCPLVLLAPAKVFHGEVTLDQPAAVLQSAF